MTAPTRQTYLGATISNFRGSLGWGSQKTSIDVTLAEDLTNGDDFIEPTVGYPTYFDYLNWNFGGIIQSWQRRRSSSGFLFDVNITDPREIIMGTNLILDGYNGLTYSVPNLYNIFGYLESTNGFGGSLNTDNGALAILMARTAQTLINTSPITFRENYYYVDLTNLINIIPTEYRIQSNTIDLFSFISTIAEEFNYDFFVRLIFTNSQNVIVPYFYNKSNPPIFGEIQNYVDFTERTYGNVANSVGRELANDTTSKFIIGGQICELFPVFQNMHDRLLTAQEYEVYQLAILDDMDANNVSPNVDDIDSYFIDKAKEANIWPYWGHDARGNVIIGIGPPDARWSLNSDGNLSVPPRHHLIGCHRFTIDGRQIAAIYNNPSLIDYHTDATEMRMAMTGFEEWVQYIMLTSAMDWHYNRTCFNGSSKYTMLVKAIGNPLIKVQELVDKLDAEAIRLVDPLIFDADIFLNSSIFDPLLDYIEEIKDIKNYSGNEIVNFGLEPVINDADKLKQVHDFLSNYANEYYGKKYMIKLPDISAYRDLDTNEVKYSLRPVDAGYFSESVLPFAISSGIAPPELDLFYTQDNRVRNYSRFRYEKTDFASLDKRSSIPSYDLTNPNETDPFYIFKESSLDETPIFLNYDTLEDPRVILTVNQSVHRQTDNAYETAPFDFLLYEHFYRKLIALVLPTAINPGSVRSKVWNAILEADSNFGEEANFNEAAGAIQMPDMVAIALESQTLTYGPWYISGLPGKTEFEKDTELVPWNFGGYTRMNLVAQAKLFQTAANQQEVERGTIEFPDIPTFMLGDSMVANGPVISDINVSIDPQAGVTTTYNLQTWTPSFGGMSKFYVDKITRLSKKESHQKFINIKNSALPGPGGSSKPEGAVLPSRPAKTPRAGKNSSSNLVLAADVMHSYNNDNERDNVTASVVTMPGYYLQNQTYDGYNTKALVSLDAIFRPFVTETQVDASGFPHFESPDITADSPHIGHLNPYGIHHDISVVGKNIDVTTASATVKPFHNDHLLDYSQVAPTSVKSIALKGPLIVAGWGYDIEGNPIPANPANENEFIEDYQKRMDQWKCGPVDLRWDDSRKVWSAGGGDSIIFGKTVNNLYANSSGLIDIFDLASGYPFDTYVNDRVYAYDMLLQDNTMHYANTTVVLAKKGNRYFIVNAGCSTC